MQLSARSAGPPVLGGTARAAQPPPEPLTPQQPHPQTFAAWGTEGGEGYGAKGMSRRKTEEGLSYKYNWDIMTQSPRLLYTRREGRDTCTRREAVKTRLPTKRKKMQPSHPAENQVLQSRDLRQWREIHTIQHGEEDKTTVLTGAQESGTIRVQLQRDTQRHRDSL